MIASCPEGNNQCLALLQVISICSAKIVGPACDANLDLQQVTTHRLLVVFRLIDSFHWSLQQ
jgi:hypothetical protein